MDVTGELQTSKANFAFARLSSLLNGRGFIRAVVVGFFIV
jgi:hypothetical protein